MLTFLDRYCSEYDGMEYDFFYLPMDFRQKDNLGYAFINFTTPAAAKRFKTLLQNFRWETADTGAIRSKKVCEITWARIQGKERLVKRFQGSNFLCDEPDFLPVLLDPPRNGLDPEPAPPIVIGGINPI
ncbi:hypothetical protein M569_11591 [Genlisea aurea]|uniref:Mei2-like C-terminal RNA recognition motif domain-containing protein n=1 Tax=Genlisea aurea TaxID=192259 RepID=S8DJY6_9LAMI|nr:hypothetical protein M569_11591 [Genlisea aurea]